MAILQGSLLGCYGINYIYVEQVCGLINNNITTNSVELVIKFYTSIID